MAFNKKIALLKITQGNGNAGGEIVTESKVVWAEVKDTGVSAKTNAEIIGSKAEIQAIIYRNCFDKHTHVDYKGERYKIEKTGQSSNNLHIKLMLGKGE